MFFAPFKQKIRHISIYGFVGEKGQRYLTFRLFSHLILSVDLLNILFENCMGDPARGNSGRMASDG